MNNLVFHTCNCDSFTIQGLPGPPGDIGPEGLMGRKVGTSSFPFSQPESQPLKSGRCQSSKSSSLHLMDFTLWHFLPNQMCIFRNAQF